MFMFGLAFALAAVPAMAGDYTVGAIEIAQPWTRATPKGAKVAGGYMTIRNKGAASDRLIGGSVDVAGRFEFHRMSMEGGVMKMRPVDGGLEIKPGESVELKPGSLHVMMMDLKQPLEKGQRVKGTLQFEKAGKVDIEFAVEALGAQAPAGEHGGHGGHGKH
jgi:copper(I)-binding protein